MSEKTKRNNNCLANKEKEETCLIHDLGIKTKEVEKKCWHHSNANFQCHKWN